MGYAFVTTRKPEMAQELIQKKRMKLEDGSDIEFKPINRNKRLVANQNCKEKNISKINDVNARNGMRNGNNNNNNNLGAIGDWRSQAQPAPEVKRKNLFGDFFNSPASNKHNYSNSSNQSIFDQPIFEMCKYENAQENKLPRKSLCSTGSERSSR